MLCSINTLNSSLQRILLASGLLGKRGHGGGKVSSPEPLKSLSLSLPRFRQFRLFTWTANAYRQPLGFYGSTAPMKTALRAHRHPSAIPLTAHFPSKHARPCKSSLTPPSAQQAAGNTPGTNGQRLLLLPPALPPASPGILTGTAAGWPGEQQEGKTTPWSTLSCPLLLQVN